MQLISVHSRAAVESFRQLGEHASYQELAEAHTRLGAAMFDAHRFHEAIEMLKCCVDDVKKHPQLLSAESRVMLFNTQARLLAIVGEEGWEELFRKSISLQELVDPSSIPRTRCYLVHACLRNNLNDVAAKELNWFENNRIPDDTKPYVSFYRADFYRRFVNCDVKYRQDKEFERNGRNHAFAFYLVSTARQHDRKTDEREERLTQAIEVLRKERGKHKGRNLLHLLGLFIELTVPSPDHSRTLREIEEVFDAIGDNTMRDWYARPLQLVHSDPEVLFEKIPYL